MGVTISTHNGSKVAREHNIRNEKVVSKEAHIDINGVHEIWIDEKPREAYERIFGKAVEDYNAKQSRQERKIKDYYNTIKEDAKKHPVYEMIIGVYGKDEYGVEICSEKQGKAIMKEFVDGWKERNTNLELIGAYYHADEQGQPHVHLDYIPVAHGYTRGMETQNGLVKAFGEMGFEKDGRVTAQIQWEARENKHLERICISKGLEVDHPKEENRQHIETAQYKAQKKLDSTIDNTKDLLDINGDLRAERGKLEAQRDKANEQTQKALERKTRAIKLRRDKDGYGYTYDKTLVTDIKQIVKEIKEDVKEISHTDLDVQTQYEQAEKLREIREYELSEGRKKRTQLIAEAQEYKDKVKDYVLGYAEKMANEKFERFKNNFMQGEQTSRLNRLEEFCEDIKFKDGTSVLEKFEEQEQKLERDMDREWSR